MNKFISSFAVTLFLFLGAPTFAETIGTHSVIGTPGGELSATTYDYQRGLLKGWVHGFRAGADNLAGKGTVDYWYREFIVRRNFVNEIYNPMFVHQIYFSIEPVKTLYLAILIDIDAIRKLSGNGDVNFWMMRIDELRLAMLRVSDKLSLLEEMMRTMTPAAPATPVAAANCASALAQTTPAPTPPV